MKPGPRLLPLAGALVAAFVFTACGGGSDLIVQQIFEAPAWTGPERYAYTVVDRGVDGEGVCELVTTPGDGTTRLERFCSKDEYRDNAYVVVETATLRPIESSRVYVDGKEGKQVTHSIAYAEGEARFTTEDGDRRRTTTRELPKVTDEQPDPGWYDDDSLLWLVRSIPLREGFEGAYAHVINAGQPRVLEVEVRVEAAERVQVPAGEFTAWKVRIERENTVYFMWVDTQAPHVMVRARIEDTTYELRPD